MLQRMVAASTGALEVRTVEVRRRTLLVESDDLLDKVERLRLEDRRDVPRSLSEAIRCLQNRLGRPDPPIPPATLHAAHDLVFAVQQRLMAANPNNPQPNRHVGRPGGQPVVTVVRAWDRWCYAQQQAVRAAREHFKPQVAVAVARTAWSNYWELHQEAELIKQRLGARPASTPAVTAAARHP